MNFKVPWVLLLGIYPIFYYFPGTHLVPKTHLQPRPECDSSGSDRAKTRCATTPTQTSHFYVDGTIPSQGMNQLIL